MENQKNLTGWIIGIIIIGLIIFMAFWGFDMLNQQISNQQQDESNEENATEDVSLLKSDHPSTYTAVSNSSRLTDEYGFDPSVIPTYGNPKGAITVIEFTNFYCGFCTIYHQNDFGRLLEKYHDDIYYASVYVFSDAYNNIELSVASACASQQGENQFSDYAFSLNKRSTKEEDILQKIEEFGLDLEEFTACYQDDTIREVIDQNEAIARDMGVYSTPFFLIDDQMLIGAEYDYMDNVIAEALQSEN